MRPPVRLSAVRWLPSFNSLALRSSTGTSGPVKRPRIRQQEDVDRGDAPGPGGSTHRRSPCPKRPTLFPGVNRRWGWPWQGFIVYVRKYMAPCTSIREACFWSLLAFRARVVSVWCSHAQGGEWDPGILPNDHREVHPVLWGMLSCAQRSAVVHTYVCCAKYSTYTRATRSAGPKRE